MFKKTIRTACVVAVMGVGVFLLGCSNDAVGNAARSSLTSFAQTLANDAISSLINP